MKTPIAAAAIVLLLAVAVRAQHPAPDPRAVPALPTIGLPLPEIGLPLPEIGLPLPQIGLQTAAEAAPSRPVVPAGPRAPQGRHRGPVRQPPVPIIVSPIYVVPADVLPPSSGDADARPCQGSHCAGTATPRGRLRVAITPYGAGAIYLDGSYIGSPTEHWDDLEIAPGLHTIEVRADGYTPIQDSVLVTSNRVLTYAATLERVAPVPEPAPASPAAISDTALTYWMIPGCYAGNVPPADAHLPAGCDPADAVEISR